MATLVRIGLAIGRSFAYDRGILRGISRYAEARPDWSFVSVILEQQPLRALGRRRPDALIAAVERPEMVRALAGWCRPLVDVAAVLPGLPFPRVGADNVDVARTAAAHFLDRGLRHFGFVGPPDTVYSTERFAAFQAALRAAGHAVAWYATPADLPFDSLGRRWDLDRGVHRWLRALPKPAGVFVPGDDWGVQAAEACRRVGLRVPEDVALLGVDDDDLDCELARPRLSSVIVPAERIGYEAAALLDRLLAGHRPPPGPILLPAQGVATRRSTEVLAIDDRDVVAAVRFIREHAHLPIRVDDVLRESPVRRRTLERRCRAALGWGLGEEIRRAHLERARRLLARTELPMAEIATKSGFTDFRHMAVAFHRALGVSPTTYRRGVRGPAP